MTRAAKLASLGAALALLAAAPRPLWAAEPDAVDPAAVARVADRLNCPICQGYTLRECPLEVCAQMRAEIGRRLGEGATDDDVVASFVALYGPSVLNEPPRRGFALLAWLAPMAMVAVAAVGAVLRGRARGAAGGSSSLPDAPAGYAERVEALARADDR